jgi:hypothetical protein
MTLWFPLLILERKKERKLKKMTGVAIWFETGGSIRTAAVGGNWTIASGGGGGEFESQ